MEAYSGWGGAQKAFSEKAEGEWVEIRDRLKELLSEDEFASQRHTVLTAFYTPAPVIGAIYDALREVGIGQGDTPAAILEPGCGTGNFMRLAPADLALDFHGVELDPISARIAQALCPEAHITAAGLEECRVSPASFDAAIGNVPYSGDIKIDGMPIHDYFIKKSVEAVRPGGIVAVLTSRYTLDKNSTATRRALAEQAELLGAVRLPAETFRRQAGTEALSDILMLRRRPEPIALSEDELPEWVETSPFEDTVNINRYFNEHPGRAVGAMSIVSGPMGPTLGVSFKGGADALGVRVSDLLRDSVDQGGAVEMAAAQEPAGISVTPTEPTKFEFSVAADGTIWYGTEDAVEPFTPGGGKTGPERARAMLGLRDGARALLALERDPAADDDEVEEAIAELSAEYDSFFERFGRINSKKNLAVFPSKGFTDHSLALNLLSLEKVDSDGEVTGKADILRKRLVTPEAPTPEHVGNPSDALAVTIDARGEVDIDFLADLMETDVQTALERLGDLVVTDPDDASHVMTADEYLSGDVGGKLEHVRELLEAERGRAERQTQQAWNEHLGFAVNAENLTGPTRDALDQLRKTHLWESSLNPTTSRFAVDGPAHVEGLDHGACGIDWISWPALIPLALEAYDGPRPIGLADCDERRWSVSTGNPLLDQLARGLGNFRSGGAGGALEATPAYAIKYLVCDSGLSDEELGAFLAAGGADPYNGSDYLEAFQSIAGVEIERPERPMYGGPSARESAIENGMRVARALRAAPDAVEYLFRIQRKQCSDECVMKIDLLEPARRTYYQNSWHAATPASLSELATEEGLERFRDHRRRFMEAAKLAVEPADADRVASLERLESRLEAVQPVKLVPGQIACQLGSSWVPASVIRDFALETFKIGYGDAARERGSHQTAAQARGLEVRYSEVSGRWSVTSASGGMAASVAKKWGVGSYNCFMILTAALNGGLIQIEKDNPDYNPASGKSKKKIPDPVATAAANAKRRELEEAFREWAWKDEGRAAMLADIYNRKLNRVAARTYSGDYLSLPGMSPDIQLRKHQRDAVARIIQDGEGTLIAHTVGAGKTFTGITAMHELKRLGRARKPMIVVPNNLTEQWAADYLKLYPDAKLLVLTDAAAKSPDSVRRFWGQAAAGDWDAVIVGFSRFEKLQMSYGAQKAALTARIDELEESRLLELSDGADEKDFSVKQIEGVRDKFKSKLKSLEGRNASKKLEGATFEEVGCDAIFVDEAHYFKNLAVSGGSVPGMQTSDAAKCEDLLMKCEYLRGNGRGNNIVFATGTPVTNTMAELYNMQRYLSPNLLDSQGVSNFSAWAKTFGEVTETLEPKPEGGGLDIKRRFARFQNLPELMSSFHCYSDIMTADDLDLDLPELESHAVAVPATPEQLAEVEALVERGEKVHAGCDPSVDNMLKITGDGRKVALDPKLLYLEDDPDMEPLSGGKVDECVRNILDIRDRTEAERGAQLVFVDSSTPASGRWNIQDDVRRRLIEAGVPRVRDRLRDRRQGQVEAEGGAVREGAQRRHPHPAGLDHDAGHRDERADAPGRDPRPRLPVAAVRPRTAPRPHRPPGQHFRPRPRLPLRLDRHVRQLPVLHRRAQAALHQPGLHQQVARANDGRPGRDRAVARPDEADRRGRPHRGRAHGRREQDRPAQAHVGLAPGRPGRRPAQDRDAVPAACRGPDRPARHARRRRDPVRGSRPRAPADVRLQGQLPHRRRHAHRRQGGGHPRAAPRRLRRPPRLRGDHRNLPRPLGRVPPPARPRRRLAALYRPGGRCRQTRPHVGQGLPFRRERSIHRAYPDGPHHRPGREGPRGDRAEAARRPARARRRAEGRQGAVPQAGRARRGRTAPRRPRAGAHRGRGAAPARAGPARRGRGRRDRGGRRGGARRRARARARGRGRRRGARGRARGGAAPPGAHLRGLRHACRGDGRAQRHRERLPGRCRRGRALLGGGIRPRGGRRRREAQGRHVSRGAFRVYAIDDTSDRGPVSGPLSH